MLPLLYSLVFVEMAVSLTLLFKTPLRSLLVMCLDAVKRGKGLIMAESVAGTLFVVLISSVYSIITIKKRSIDAGAVTPTDQVLLANHILEVTLMGNSSFLRYLHIYIGFIMHDPEINKSLHLGAFGFIPMYPL